jgi:ribonuclease BN (tRNA processing enzyme)
MARRPTVIARLLILVLGVVSLFAGVFLSCQMWRYRELAKGIAWLENRDFERATLIAVGTGGAAENSSRLGPVTAIGVGDRVLLVDAGRGAADALRNCSIPVAQPDTLLLTSLLPENTLGLDDLLLTGWNTPRMKPLRVLGPPGTRARAESIVAAYAASVDTLATARGVTSDGARLDVVEIGDGFVETRDGLTLRAAAVGDAPLPSLAYRFEANDRALVVAGTNPDPDRLVTFASGATLLAGEGFYAESIQMAEMAEAPDLDRLKREAALHLPMQKLGEIATRAGVGGLVVTRLQPAPLFEAQYETAVGTTFKGAAVIADECEEIAP